MPFQPRLKSKLAARRPDEKASPKAAAKATPPAVRTPAKTSPAKPAAKSSAKAPARPKARPKAKPLTQEGADNAARESIRRFVQASNQFDLTKQAQKTAFEDDVQEIYGLYSEVGAFMRQDARERVVKCYELGRSLNAAKAQKYERFGLLHFLANLLDIQRSELGSMQTFAARVSPREFAAICDALAAAPRPVTWNYFKNILAIPDDGDFRKFIRRIVAGEFDSVEHMRAAAQFAKTGIENPTNRVLPDSFKKVLKQIRGTVKKWDEALGNELWLDNMNRVFGEEAGKLAEDEGLLGALDETAERLRQLAADANAKANLLEDLKFKAAAPPEPEAPKVETGTRRRRS